MLRKPMPSFTLAKPTWIAFLLLLPTCISETREPTTTELGVQPRILKMAPDSEVATWQRVTSAVAPEGRFLHALTLDETRGVVVMFGGLTRSMMSSAVQALGDIWEWSLATGTWTLRKSNGMAPAARGGAAMVFDPVRNKVLMFGGRAASGYDYEDLWEWDPGSGAWLERGAGGTHPPARAQHAMLYQKSTNKILLFGGGRSSTNSDGTGVSASFGDTWELDSATATWTALTPSNSPSTRHDFGMVWDSKNNKVVLFGGMQIDIPGATGVPKQDTWEWDAGAHTWTERTSPGSKPSQRFALAMAYDDTRSRVVLMGGSDMQTNNSKNDVWEWDANTGAWTQTRTGAEAGMPGVRSYSSMVYDHAHTRLVMIAGTVSYNDASMGYKGLLPSNEVWEIDPAALTFNNRTVAYQGPNSRAYHAMAYNPATGKVYVFGGVDMGKKGSELADLWEWDGSVWTEVAGDSKPDGRLDAALAYDPARQSLILFGGNSWSGKGIPNDTWEWRSSTRDWIRVSTSGAPETRWGHAMVTDPIRKKILLYGGSGSKASLGSEIWEWDGAAQTWTNRTPPPTATSPKGRAYPVMSFDETRGKLMLYDGSRDLLGDSESTSAYWEWDGVSAGWALHDPHEILPDATNVYAVYDSVRRRHVLFTDAPDANVPQTWELDANAQAWVTRLPSPTPMGRFRSGMVFDSGRRVVVLFGGNINATPSGPANDTWEYSVGKLVNGQGCTAASAASCASGQCVDGVCCETAGCTGPCMACNVLGSEGTCVLAQAGTEVAGSCSNGQACDGTGACKSKNGQACSAASGCASGFCVDGICCDSACTGACKACNLTGRIGTCTPQAAGSDPDGECGQGTGTCKSSCDGVGACVFPLGLSCGSCLTCDGAGACTRADPGCGGSGGTGGTAGNGGKDSYSTKPIPGSGGSAGTVSSSGGVAGKSSPGSSGGGGGGSVSSAGSKGGSAGSSSPSGGSVAGALSSSPSAGAGGGGIVSSSSGSGAGIPASSGGVGGSGAGSKGGSGGASSPMSSGLSRDAGAGADGSAGAAGDAGRPQGDASAGDAALVGRLGHRGCACNLGRGDSSSHASLFGILLAGVCWLTWRPRRRRKPSR